MSERGSQHLQEPQKEKGTCGCCVSCSQRNPTFLRHLAQSPGVGLHPAILLLQEEEKNQVREGNTRPAPPCTALHKPHTRLLGAVMPLEPSRRSKASHQQQQFFCLSYQPQGQIPKLLYSSSILGLDSCRRFLHAPELAAHGWGDFVCSPHIKKKIITNNHMYASLSKLCFHTVFCASKTNKRVFAQEVSKLLEFTQSFAGRAGSWRRDTSRTELQKNVLNQRGSSLKRHKVIKPLAPLSARPAFAASRPCRREGTLLLPRVRLRSGHTGLRHLPTPTR